MVVLLTLGSRFLRSLVLGSNVFRQSLIHDVLDQAPTPGGEHLNLGVNVRVQTTTGNRDILLC
jgi:hypothetical protein